MDTTTRLDHRRADQSRLTPSERSQRARIAARTKWARQDPSAGTQAAREAFMARFDREVDPDGKLPQQERERRAYAARQLYFQRMAYARSRNRAKAAQPADTRAPVIYFLRRGDLIKIGTTVDLPRRVSSFQHRLEDVVATLPGSYEAERLWHLRFGHLRVPAGTCGGTEWFRAEDELMDAIAAARAAVTGEGSTK